MHLKINYRYLQCNELKQNLDLLEQRRDEYATSNASKKNRLAAGIISLEEKVEKEHTELQKLEREVRRLEHEKIYK